MCMCVYVFLCGRCYVYLVLAVDVDAAGLEHAAQLVDVSLQRRQVQLLVRRRLLLRDTCRDLVTE